jgi:prepilin-type N-terminal cleavage/methylation domain-containing protein/prepilin-type processing-associated H-X9-DG protein
MKRRGFTLTELLVTIAVVVVIAGIAWPVSNAMIGRSRQAACLGKLRAIGTALELYLQEHHQRYPEIEAMRGTRADGDAVLEVVLEPYLGERSDVFHCPADKQQFAKSGSSYGWNSTQSGNLATRLTFFGIADRPSLIPLVYDKEEWHPGGVNFLYADASVSRETRFVTGGKR